MKLTSVRALLLIAAVSAVGAFAVLGGWEQFRELPGVPRTAPLALAVVGGLLLVVTLSLRSRLRQREAAARAFEAHPEGVPPQTVPRPVDPFVAARSVALAKASSHVGALVGGWYAGYAVYLLPTVEVDARRERALLCGLSVLACVAIVAVALWLERVLRLPDDRERGGPGLGSVA